MKATIGSLMGFVEAMGSGVLPVFQWTTLSVVRVLGQRAYGAEIRRALSAELGRDVAIGQVFACLARLEQAGLIEAVDDSEEDRASRRRRLFHLTSAGLEALERTAFTARAFANYRRDKELEA